MAEIILGCISEEKNDRIVDLSDITKMHDSRHAKQIVEEKEFCIHRTIISDLDPSLSDPDLNKFFREKMRIILEKPESIESVKSNSQLYKFFPVFEKNWILRKEANPFKLTNYHKEGFYSILMIGHAHYNLPKDGLLEGASSKIGQVRTQKDYGLCKELTISNILGKRPNSRLGSRDSPGGWLADHLEVWKKKNIEEYVLILVQDKIFSRYPPWTLLAKDVRKIEEFFSNTIELNENGENKYWKYLQNKKGSVERDNIELIAQLVREGKVTDMIGELRVGQCIFGRYTLEEMNTSIFVWRSKGRTMRDALIDLIESCDRRKKEGLQKQLELFGFIEQNFSKNILQRFFWDKDIRNGKLLLKEVVSEAQVCLDNVIEEIHISSLHESMLPEELQRWKELLAQYQDLTI